VIRNRAVDGGYGGHSIPGVALARNQFEPWNGGEAKRRMLALSPDDPRYQAIGKQVDAAYFGANDPTEGATHFYSPVSQAALGRKPPSWAGGEFTEIGGHRFYSPDDEPAQGPARVASALPFAPAATTTPAAFPQNPPSAAPESVAGPSVPPSGVGMVAQAFPQAQGRPPAPAQSGIDQVARVLSNPFLPPQMASALTNQLKPKEQHVQETDSAGNIWDVNRGTNQRSLLLKKDPSYGEPYKDADGNLVQKDAAGKITVLSGAEKTPTSVAESEYYRKNFQGSAERPKPMDYDTWATAKARAAAINIGNVTTTAGGGSDKQIFDALEDRTKEARATANGLIGIRNARNALLGDGGVITGSGADFRLQLQKAASAMGYGDASKIVNTETFRAAIAPQVAAVLKSTVGSANISNSDREFAERAAGGSITLDEKSIGRLLDIMERASMARLQDHQDQLDAIYPDAEKHKRERALFGVKVPTSAVMPVGKTRSGIGWSVE
jgi:hypothetical protein